MAVGKEQAVFVAGHRGMVGAAIVRRLSEMGYRRILYARTMNLI